MITPAPRDLGALKNLLEMCDTQKEKAQLYDSFSPEEKRLLYVRSIQVHTDNGECIAMLKSESENINEIIRQVNEKVGQHNWSEIRIANDEVTE